MNRLTRFAAFKAALLAGAAFSAPAAYAQDADEPQAGGDIITVTGSRVQRDGFSKPTPVSVIGAEQYDLRITNSVADLLNEAPAFAPSSTPTSTGISLLASGANILDLRGLGTNRVLTLVDGRRFISGGTRSNGVDLNALPSALIDRVEVVTGGAASVYGSDAVAGVVNVIYKEDYEGAAIEAFGGVSSEGDAERVDVSGAFGRRFNDRLHIQAGFDYADSEGFFQRDREYSNRGTALIPNPADTGPNDGIPAQITATNVTVPVVSDFGVPLALVGPSLSPTPIPVDPANPFAAFLQFGPNGTLVPFNPGQIVDPALGAAIGGDGVHPTAEPFLQHEVPVERFSATADLTYALTDDTDFFLETTISLVDSNNQQAPFFDLPGEVIIPANNPFVPPELQAALAALGAPAFTYGRLYTEYEPLQQTSERDTYRIATGLEGEFRGWSWETYYQYGRTESEIIYNVNRIQSNFLAAVGALNPATLQPFAPCVDPCVPLNLFGPNAADPAALDFVFQPTLVEDATLQQHVAAGVISGEPFALPAGPVGVAAGVEYRREDIESVVGERFQAGDTFINPFFPIDGDFNVVELFGETVVPILADKPFAENLELNAAVRYADYSSVGGTVTWKVGASWLPVEGFRVRSTVSRDIRAPNISELFQPGGGGVIFVQDPCSAAQRASNPTFDANCTALGLPTAPPPAFGFQESNILGNPDLSEETADTFTIGAVVQPPAIPGLSISLDYFDIQIDDAIAVLGVQEVVTGCYTSADPLNEPFCAQVQRNGLGQIDSVNSNFLNLNQLSTSGIDFEVRYGTRLADLGLPEALGRIDVNLTGTWLDSFEQITGGPTGGAVIDNTGEIGLSEWQWNLSAQHTVGDFTGFLQVRYIGEADNNNQDTIEQIDVQVVDPEVYLNLSARYRLPVSLGAESAVLFAGVDNVTNNEPPFLPSENPFFTDGATYDVRGRFYRAGVSLEF